MSVSQEKDPVQVWHFHLGVGRTDLAYTPSITGGMALNRITEVPGLNSLGLEGKM